jgi:hypothetical protein
MHSAPHGAAVAVVVAGVQSVGVAMTAAVMSDHEGPPCSIENDLDTSFPPLASAISSAADASVRCSRMVPAPAPIVDASKAIVDVGTGGRFRVPSLLGVGARPPLLHGWCAGPVRLRAAAATSQLDARNIAELVAFLKTL